jgi:hypothetical protein
MSGTNNKLPSEDLFIDVPQNEPQTRPSAKKAKSTAGPPPSGEEGTTGAGGTQEEEALEIKKRQREFEMEKLRDLRADIRAKEMTAREREMGLVVTFANTMAMLNPDWREDTRLRLQTEDWLKNVAFKDSAIANGDVPLTQSISVSQVAKEMGYTRLTHSQEIKIGKLAAKNYLKKHGEAPSKHRQWVQGAEREVNSYTEGDRDCVEAAIKALM